MRCSVSSSVLSASWPCSVQNNSLSAFCTVKHHTFIDKNSMHNWNHTDWMAWQRETETEREREREREREILMRLCLGTSFYRFKNKQENEQNGGPEKPYEKLMDGYYLAVPGWMAAVRFKRCFFFFLLSFLLWVKTTLQHVSRIRAKGFSCCGDLFKSQTL